MKMTMGYSDHTREAEGVTWDVFLKRSKSKMIPIRWIRFELYQDTYGLINLKLNNLNRIVIQFSGYVGNQDSEPLKMLNME